MPLTIIFCKIALGMLACIYKFRNLCLEVVIVFLLYFIVVSIIFSTSNSENTLKLLSNISSWLVVLLVNVVSDSFFIILAYDSFFLSNLACSCSQNIPDSIASP